MNQSFFDSLPDDALVAIGSWVAATGVENFARCLKVNRRFRSVLGKPALLQEIIDERINNRCTGIETLEHFALWEAVGKVGLWDENRIGFDYASIDIARDNPRRRDEDDILNSQKRVRQVARILIRFPDSFLRVEAHCGTGAPMGIAERFSVARGMSVVRSFLEILSDQMDQNQDENAEEYFHAHDLAIVEQRLRLTSWGRQIAEAAEASQHPYGSVARLGKGWVELYVCHGDGLEMPKRPDFYQGQTRQPNEENNDDDEDDHVVVYMRIDDDDMDDEASDSGDGNRAVRPVDDMGAIEDYDDSDEDD